MASERITRICSIEGCGRKHRCNGFCNAHNTRWLLHGDKMDIETPIRECSRTPQYIGCRVEGCDSPHTAKGWCEKHWERWRQHGDPLYERKGHGLHWWKRSDPDFEEYFWSKANVGTPEECWEWQYILEESGYGNVWVDRKPRKSHRIAYELFYKKVPTLHVLHSCDNPKCVNPHHLREGTNDDNIRDKMERGRSTFVPRCAKIEQVREIRKLFREGSTVREISEKFGFTKVMVRDIRKRKTWKHVE